MKVEITCDKDENVAEYCRSAFGDRFQRKVDHNLPLSGPGTIHLLLTFRSALRDEAERQEWYDFEVVDGRRKVLYNDDETPKLLIPTVRIV